MGKRLVTTETPRSGWSSEEQVDWYLGRVDHLEPRQAGESVLCDVIPSAPRTVLDLGCGDGRLAALVLRARPTVERIVAIDISPPMLERTRQRFHTEPRVEVKESDLRDDIRRLGAFDVVLSGCAIHHLEDDRKVSLFREISDLLNPGGRFANLDVVASATPQLHQEFLAAIGRTADDPEDRLVEGETQLHWMRQAGLVHVDCLWRWRGMALLVGRANGVDG